MIDARRHAVFLEHRGKVDDRTRRIADCHGPDGTGRVRIRFVNSDQVYEYGPARAKIAHGQDVPIPRGAKVSVKGEIWPSVTDVWAFDGPSGSFRRVFYRRPAGEVWLDLPAEDIEILTGAEQDQAAASILEYWRAVAGRLEADAPSRMAYERMDFVHPDSVLGRLLVGASIQSREPQVRPIFPFRCNLSQREAVDRALSHSISVIEGPPGTGKTETILNLIASVVASGQGTVGVVSLSNAAVDNVQDKLTDLGFGYVIAGLGRRAKREEFFAAQPGRNAEVKRFLDIDHEEPPPGRLAEIDARLRAAQDRERRRAELRLDLDAHLLELRHFEDHLSRQQVPDIDGFPLLRRSSERILHFLAETHFDTTDRPGLLRRIRRYLRYGSLRGLDPSDTDVVLRLQWAFYGKRIAELRAELERVDARLRQEDFDRLVADHQELSGRTLQASLSIRYGGLSSTTYAERSYRSGKTFRQFSTDYPVLLSTCHSLRRSIPAGALLDYLIIDEASQVDLLAAGLAVSCCRNLVVVGDRRQLEQISSSAAEGLTAPHPAFDYRRQSILTSLGDLYGEQLPVILLREHYRCDPAIIGFCNKAFYGGNLIPFTSTGAEQPMIVVRTVAGHHMRQHRGGGRSNQREVDVIATEVIPRYCADIPPTDVGITTPYNRQANKITAALMESIDSDTVHKFQGRQKPIIILTTVLDETWRGRTGQAFVDDPRMINVAVSRAARRFILVTNNELMPSSRYIRDLIGYIGYHDPDHEVVDSGVVSVFDLLYREYDRILGPLAERLRRELKYPSEDIVWTVLKDLLDQDAYSHLLVVSQVLLRNLLPDMGGLTAAQARYVRHRASVDFVVYNRVTNQPWLAIEVDGFAYHENDPRQLERDALKDQILRDRRLPLLRLPTTGSGEEQRIRDALDRAELRWSQIDR